MNDLIDLFDMLGVDLGLAVSIGTSVFAVVALLRSEIKGDWMKGWKSKAIGGVIALLLAVKAVPITVGAEIASYFSVLMTGVVGWGAAMMPHKITKGSILEIKRNGK